MARWIIPALLLASSSALAFDPKNIVFNDPTGDDKGPGTCVYPTGADYKPGSFDLTGLAITDKGNDVEFRVKVRVKIEDPWNSKGWGGNGFSLQMVQVYIDSKKGGFLDSLPGINVKFPKGQAWDKVVFISPQPKSRIVSEVKNKKLAMLKAVVVPTSVQARGNEIIALVPKSELGGAPAKEWGFQAIMQSNEGYPDAESVLSRNVNQDAGQHRFGGGNDYHCDPHAIDLLAGAGKGGADEKDAQYKALKAYTCDASGKGKKAVVPMLYPGRSSARSPLPSPTPSPNGAHPGK